MSRPLLPAVLVASCCLDTPKVAGPNVSCPLRIRHRRFTCVSVSVTRLLPYRDEPPGRRHTDSGAQGGRGHRRKHRCMCGGARRAAGHVRPAMRPRRWLGRTPPGAGQGWRWCIRMRPPVREGWARSATCGAPWRSAHRGQCRASPPAPVATMAPQAARRATGDLPKWGRGRRPPAAVGWCRLGTSGKRPRGARFAVRGRRTTMRRTGRVAARRIGIGVPRPRRSRPLWRGGGAAGAASGRARGRPQRVSRTPGTIAGGVCRGAGVSSAGRSIKPAPGIV